MWRSFDSRAIVFMLTRFLTLLSITLFLAEGSKASQSLVLTPDMRGNVKLPTSTAFQSLSNWRIEGQIDNWVSNSTTWVGVFEVDGLLQIRIYNNYLIISGSASEYLDLYLGSTRAFRWVVQRNTAKGTYSVAMWDQESGTYKWNSVAINQAAQSPVDARGRGMSIGSMYETISPTLHLGFLRWYTTLRPEVTEGGQPPVITGAPTAELLDYEFEGNLRDTRSGITFSFSAGSTTYAVTGAFPPAVTLKGTAPAIRAGSGVTLDASASFSNSDSPDLTYRWQQIDGPESGSWTNESTATPTFAAPVLGAYSVRLSVSDTQGRAAEKDLQLKAVPADDKNIVILNNEPINQIIGPLARFGSNPWPWFDTMNKYFADGIIAGMAQYWPRFWDTETEAGTTVKITTASNTVAGVGTHFISAFCTNGNVPCALQSGGGIILWTANEDYPTTPGRRLYLIKSVDSDTQLTLAGGSGFNAYYSTTCANGAPAEQCELKWTALNNSNNLYNYYWGASYRNHANYYDNVLALYALYYRTGDPLYQTHARALADAWWSMPRIDMGSEYPEATHASFFPEPRDHAFLGLVLRALDGRPEMWTGLYHMLEYYAHSMGIVRAMPYNNVGDMREMGYWITAMSLCSLYAPAEGVITGGTFWDTSIPVKQRCTTALQDMADFLAAKQGPNGNWMAMIHNYGSDGGGKGVGGGMALVTTGSSIVGQAASPTAFGHLPDHNAEFGYPTSKLTVWFAASSAPQSNADGDQAVYNVIPFRWSAAKGTLEKIVVADGSATATLSEGHGLLSGGSVYVSDSATAALNGDVVLSSSNATTVSWATSASDGTYTDAVVSDNDHFALDRPYEATGCETGCTRGWFAGGLAGYGTQPFMQGLAGNAFGQHAYPAMVAAGDMVRADLYKKFSVDSALWLYNYATRPVQKGLYYGVDFPGCAQNVATGLDIPPGIHVYCTNGDDASNSRVLLGEAQGALSAAYMLSPTPTLKAIGDAFYSALWSKDGTNPIIAGDGVWLYPMDSAKRPEGYWYMGVPADWPNSKPYFADFGDAKWLGFFFGRGAGYQWPAASLGGVAAAALRSVSLPLQLSAAGSGAYARVTVIRPDGTKSQTLCSASPCQVVVDARQGTHLIKVDYLSSGQKVIHPASAYAPLVIRP